MPLEQGEDTAVIVGPESYIRLQQGRETVVDDLWL
jgi:hypothetical protein